MIRAIYRKGKIQPVDAVPPAWSDGQELIVEEATARPRTDEDDGWMAELNAAAAQIPDRVHEELAVALERLEAESKELGRREMERTP